MFVGGLFHESPFYGLEDEVATKSEESFFVDVLLLKISLVTYLKRKLHVIEKMKGRGCERRKKAKQLENVWDSSRSY